MNRDFREMKVVDSALQGFKVYHYDGMFNPATQNWEPQIRQWLIDNTPTKKLVIDFGANVGPHTLPFSRIFERVVAIEPHPFNVKVLTMNLELNGINNVTVLQKAGWSKPMKLFLNQPRRDDAASYVRSFEKETGEGENYEVEAITLDSLSLAPNAIKLDVEGAEKEILLGGLETIRNHKPTFEIEIHKYAGVSIGDIVGVLSPLGYEHSVLFESSEVANVGFSVR